MKATAAGLGALSLVPNITVGQTPAKPFGTEFPNLESLTTGKWWAQEAAPKNQTKAKGKGGGATPAPAMSVPRENVIAYALDTHQNGVLKVSKQLFPLMSGEERIARLELLQQGKWLQVARVD